VEHPARILLASAGAWAAALALNRSLRRVHGESMAPTLRAGQLVVTVPTALRRPRRGDLVEVRDPREPRRAMIKRVVAFGGEIVEVRTGLAAVDGQALTEPYARPDASEDLAVVPDGHLYVLGDNRGASTDSRTFGPVATDAVTAVVVAARR
jgi:signal peptidase I